MSGIRRTINEYGIVTASGIYSEYEIDSLNRSIDAHFSDLENLHRSYAYSRDLMNLGVSHSIFNEALIRSCFEIIDHPILYHFHIYEIASQQDQPHIAGSDLHGWHRDVDSAYDPQSPSHVSLFVNLGEVGTEDGALEFMPNTAHGEFPNRRLAVQARGRAGSAFFWNRHFYHRASPNRGTRRRRVLKISIQPNDVYSRHLETDYLQDLASRMKTVDDPRIRMLFGAYVRRTPPHIDCEPSGIAYRRPPADIPTDVGAMAIAKSRLRKAYHFLRPKTYLHTQPANYD